MAATTHNFSTNVSSTSVGQPSFLSSHLEAMCPASQEEDEWMEQQLEKARAERGGFYKRLTNSRTQSSRDIDGAAEKRRAAAAAHAARDVSISSTTTSSPAPTAIPEPHSSWRFYTSFDNGEWKRHCVPVYKPEDEVVGKIQKSAEAVKEAKAQTSPAYESHLKKYREARANLFDHPPARTRLTESMPREQTTTVRVTGAGLHDDMVLYGGKGGGAYAYPPGGNNAYEMQMRNFGGENLLNGGLPVSFPKQNYREETSTKEVITTVVGGNEGGKMKQLMPAPGQEHATTRRRSHNLGYQEKIIIPTKYKTEEERMAIEASLAESSSRLASEQSMAERLKQKSAAEFSSEHPSFMGSTFEKFRSDGAPLIKPTFEDPSSSSPVRSNSRGPSMKEVEREQPPQLPRIIPVFDEPSSIFNKPSISVNRSSFESSVVPAQNFERTIVESRTNGSSPLASSTPIASRDVETRELSVISAPSIRPVFGELSTVSQKITMKESMPDMERSSLSTGIIRSEDSNVEAYFGKNFAPFQAPTAASIGGELGILPAQSHPSDNSRTIVVTSGGASAADSSAIVPATSVDDNSVVFIPVIRVVGTPSRQRHTSEITINVNEEATPTKGASGGQTDISGQFENILKLHEDKHWIDSEIAKHTPDRFTPDIFSTPVRNTSVSVMDANVHSGQSPSNVGQFSSKSLFSTNNDSSITPSDRHIDESVTVKREKPVFPSAGNSGTTREIYVSRNFSENGDLASRPGIQVETTRYVTNEQRSVPGKTVEIDRRTQDGNRSDCVRHITATSSSVSSAPMEKIIEPRRHITATSSSVSSAPMEKIIKPRRHITATSSSVSSAPMEKIIEPRRSVEIKSVVTGEQQSGTRGDGGSRSSGAESSRIVMEVDDWIVEKAV